MRKTLNDFIREALCSREFEGFYKGDGDYEYRMESCKAIIGDAFLRYLTQEHDQTIKNLNGLEMR